MVCLLIFCFYDHWVCWLSSKKEFMTVTGGLLELLFGSTYLPRHATYWPVVFCFSLFSRFNFDLSSRKTCVCRLTGLRRPYPTCFCEAFYIYCVVGLIFACQFLLTVRECLTIQVEGIFMQVDRFALNLPYMLWLSVLHLLFSRFTFLHVLSRKMFMQIGWFALNLPCMLWLSVLHLLFSLVGYNFCMSMLIDYAWIFHLSHSKNMIYEPCRSLICVTCKY